MDDLAVYTPKVTPDNYTGNFTPMKTHLTAIESIFYALSRFGWLISLRKSTIAKPTFVFLGATWNMDEETIGINSDRLHSILEWREPRSVAEASSRLSSLMYYEHQALWLKRIAFPLFMFADARFNNAYPAIVKVKLFVCIGEMISFRYGTRIPANLAQ